MNRMQVFIWVLSCVILYQCHSIFAVTWQIVSNSMIFYGVSRSSKSSSRFPAKLEHRETPFLKYWLPVHRRLIRGLVSSNKPQITRTLLSWFNFGCLCYEQLRQWKNKNTVGFFIDQVWKFSGQFLYKIWNLIQFII